MDSTDIFPYLEKLDTLISECHRLENILQTKLSKSIDAEEDMIEPISTENEFAKYKKRTVSFCGMNNTNFNQFMKSNQLSKEELKIKIQDAVVSAAEDGYFVFLNSCMTDFDIFAGISLLEIKEKLNLDILMVCPYPYDDYLYANYVSDKNLSLARDVLKRSDALFPLFHKYNSQCRNIYLSLFNASNMVICFNTANSRYLKHAIKYTEYQQIICSEMENATNEN